jgi:NAD(P)-dependent dehydrogenase (short-subunit alcohol dehydrogenase family)
MTIEAAASPGLAVITGAASGIGLAAALRLGRRHPLVICDVNADRLEQAAAFTAREYRLPWPMPARS